MLSLLSIVLQVVLLCVIPREDKPFLLSAREWERFYEGPPLTEAKIYGIIVTCTVVYTTYQLYHLL